MELEILEELEKRLFKHYKSLGKDPFLFVEIDEDSGFIVINWSPIYDEYINETRLNQYAKFMKTFLQNKGQEGYFYIGDYAYKV